MRSGESRQGPLSPRPSLGRFRGAALGAGLWVEGAGCREDQSLSQDGLWWVLAAKLRNVGACKGVLREGAQGVQSLVYKHCGEGSPGPENVGCVSETQAAGPLAITSVIPTSCLLGEGWGISSWSHPLYDSTQSPRPAAAETLPASFRLS